MASKKVFCGARRPFITGILYRIDENAARSYLISILSAENLEERATITDRLTIPQCSDAVIPLVNLHPPLPKKNNNYQLFIPMKYKCRVSVRKELLSVFSSPASAAHPSLSSVF